jgi:hypothetical protein
MKVPLLFPEAGKETPVALVAQGRIIPLLPAPNSKDTLVLVILDLPIAT